MNIKLLLGLIIYKIAPIHRNRYVFTSFNGHYSDNTKAISIKLHEMAPLAEIVWLLNNDYNCDIPKYVKTVDINSLSSYWYRGTATAQIDNVYGFSAQFRNDNSIKAKIELLVLSYLTSKKKQPIFATMHGAALLKKIGRDQIGNTVMDMKCSNSYLLVNDDFTANVLKRVTFGKMFICSIGSPRNDVLFYQNNDIKGRIGLPGDKRIILYAPTFRNDGADVDGKNVYRSGLNQLSDINFDMLFQTLQEKFGGEWVMVCRFHYHVANMVNWDNLNSLYPGKFINGNEHDDMADYLVCADILLTDSSSSAFDFWHTKKPIFIYFPDIDNYRNKERGFYVDIEDLPFTVADKFTKLIDNIEEYNQLEYSQKVDEWIEKIGDKNDGYSSLRAVNFILDRSMESDIK